MPFSTPKESIGQVRIKRGAVIWQDHSAFKWPNCFAPGMKDIADDPDMVFTARKGPTDAELDLVAHGYGDLSVLGAYGSGSIFVKADDVEFVGSAEEAALIRARMAIAPIVKAFRCHASRYEKVISKFFDEMPDSFPITLELTAGQCRALERALASTQQTGEG